MGDNSGPEHIADEIMAFLHLMNDRDLSAQEIREWQMLCERMKPVTFETAANYVWKTGLLTEERYARLEAGCYFEQLGIWGGWGGFAVVILGLIGSSGWAIGIGCAIGLLGLVSQLLGYCLSKQNPGPLVLWLVGGFVFFLFAEAVGIAWWIALLLWLGGIVTLGGVAAEFLEGFTDGAADEPAATEAGDEPGNTESTGEEEPIEVPDGPTLDDCYDILDCDPSDSTDDIKAAYRKLAKEYHPDTIANKKLPEGFIKFANQRFHEIQEAYEHIMRERGHE